MIVLLIKIIWSFE